MTIQKNREQKDYLDAIENRLLMRYPNERKYNKKTSGRLLQGESYTHVTKACRRKAEASGNVSVPVTYQTQLQPDS